MNQPVLDPCCGSRMFWFDKQNPHVVYGDIRNEQHELCDGRQLIIEPDMHIDFTDMPFDDETFHLVVFDPPHLERAGPKSWMAKKYGKLGADWRDDLKAGFAECFRVLKPNGTLIFKWNETHIPVSQILALTKLTPLFGHKTGRQSKTHWICFFKTGGKESC